MTTRTPLIGRKAPDHDRLGWPASACGRFSPIFIRARDECLGFEHHRRDGCYVNNSDDLYIQDGIMEGVLLAVTGDPA